MADLGLEVYSTFYDLGVDLVADLGADTALEAYSTFCDLGVDLGLEVYSTFCDLVADLGMVADLGLEVYSTFCDLGVDLVADLDLEAEPPFCVFVCGRRFFICSLTKRRPNGTVNSIKLANPPKSGSPPLCSTFNDS